MMDMETRIAWHPPFMELQSWSSWKMRRISALNKILLVNACVREHSRTRILADRIMTKLDGEVDEINLEKLDLHPLTRELLRRRDELLAAGEYAAPEFEAAHRFAAADVIVFAAPYWDCSFPSSVKVFIEHIMVNGITFAYTAEGIPRGRCKAEKVWYVSTVGGSVKGMNLGYEYIRTLSEQYWGIPETKLFQAENLDIAGADPEKIIEEIIYGDIFKSGK